MTKYNVGKASIFVLTAALFVASFLLGKTITSVSADRKDDNEKVNICHKDGRSGNYSAISVDDDGHWHGHDDHAGDFLYSGPLHDGKPTHDGDEWCEDHAPSDSESQDGVCGITLNSCEEGTFSDKNDTNKEYKWDCKGTGEGKDSHCSLDITDGNPTDVCPNIPESQPELPTGYHFETIDEVRQCVADSTANDPNDVCFNLEGTQTSIPDGYHKDTPDGACNTYQFGGAPQGGNGTGGQVLGASTGKVLGASTMAGTGSFTENLYMAIMGLGAIITAAGAKNFKKAFQEAK